MFDALPSISYLKIPCRPKTRCRAYTTYDFFSLKIPTQSYIDIYCCHDVQLCADSFYFPEIVSANDICESMTQKAINFMPQ